MASNELDEYLIQDMKEQGSRVTIWGVGTHLVTGKEQPALDGVYKLSAIQDEKGKWLYKLKTSEELIKSSNPGILQVRRFYDEKGNIADMIYDIHAVLGPEYRLVDALDPTKSEMINPTIPFKDLLVPAMRQGKRVYKAPPLPEIRAIPWKALQILTLLPGDFSIHNPILSDWKNPCMT